MYTSRMPPAAQIQQMIPLVIVNANNVLELQPGAIQAINKFIQGQIYMICFEDFQNNGYAGSLQVSKTTIKNKKSDNCLLIRPSVIVDPQTRKNLCFAQIMSNNNIAKQKLHVLASLISSVLLSIVQIKSNTPLLASVKRRVIIQDQRMSRGKGTKAASLICINPIHAQNPDHFVESTDYFLNKFKQQNTLGQILEAYSGVVGIQCAQQALVNPSPIFIDKLKRQIDISAMSERQNNQLMYGPILAKYIENLCAQINNNQDGKVYVTKAQNQIVIDQGYDAYMSAVDKFHKTSLYLVDKNSKPSDLQLQQMLDTAKLKSFQQFYAKGGSANSQYRNLLDDYISNKSRDVNDLYSEQQWNRNLSILQNQSKQVLDKIQASKVKDKNVIMSYVSQMSKNYSQNARGPQKYQILNDYLKVFTPIAFQTDPDKQAKLRQEQRRNQDLQARVRQLRKQKSTGCCSKCSIM